MKLCSDAIFAAKSIKPKTVAEMTLPNKHDEYRRNNEYASV